MSCTPLLSRHGQISPGLAGVDATARNFRSTSFWVSRTLGGLARQLAHHVDAGTQPLVRRFDGGLAHRIHLWPQRFGHGNATVAVDLPWGNESVYVVGGESSLGALGQDLVRAFGGDQETSFVAGIPDGVGQVHR